VIVLNKPSHYYLDRIKGFINCDKSIHMRRLNAVVFSLLMVLMSLSVVTNSLNENVETSSLDELKEPKQVISPLSQLNQPGFQEGSIHTNSTLTSGFHHSCVILDNGAVSCWGGDNYAVGVLGNGVPTYNATPTQTSNFGNNRTAVSVSGGVYHTCAILNTGEVSCWGAGTFGALGNSGTSDQYTPVDTSSLGNGRTAVAISAGGAHTCVILDNGDVSCWGVNELGRLGHGTTSQFELTPTLTSSLGNGRTAVAISAGGAHTCALLDNGAVSCWGYGIFGQLGIGVVDNKSSPTLITGFGQGLTAVSLSSGFQHTCAILSDGSVSCWGWNSKGQLGNGGFIDQLSPTQTSSLGANRTAIAISSGQYHTCVILDSGNVSCWGEGSDGQLTSAPSTQSTPLPISNMAAGRTVVGISTGAEGTCAILDNGTVSCWGSGWVGNGQTSISKQTTPTPTSSFGPGRDVAVSERDFDGDGVLNIFDRYPLIHSPGFQEASVYTKTTLSSGGAHTCAILDDGTVACWGDNMYGELGNGGRVSKTTPTTVNNFGGGKKATAISSGGAHTCAILDSGEVSCWGWGSSGQLGNGGTSDKTTPTLTSSLGQGRSAIAISTGVFHTCAILDDGSVVCWGKGNQGELGDGSQSPADKYVPTPISNANIPSGRSAVAISSGGTHTCALLDDGKVLCWGRYYGSTPNSAFTNVFESGQDVVALASGRMHICFLLGNGNVSCTGEGSLGQLGNGNYFDNYFSQPTPTLGFGQGRHAIALSAGQDHTCALLDNGSAACWGNNDMGQIGNGTTSTYAAVPSLASTLGTDQRAVALSSGGYHSCAVLDNDEVMCWGKGDLGQLGNGATFDRTTPTKISSLGTNKKVVLSERDIDSDGILNIFEGILCVPGTYLVSGACVDADPGYFVSNFGQESQTPCAAGTFQSLSGQTECKVAEAGYFVNASLGDGQTNQTACPGGTYNPVNGSTGEDECILTEPGHFAYPFLGNPSQIPCGIGSFQPDYGQYYCLISDLGHYVLATTGQINQIPCPESQYQDQYLQTSCKGADIGHYVDTALGTGQTNQTPCPVGTFQANTGQTSCVGADVGHYIDVALGTGQTEQSPCPAETYQSETGQTSCNVASPGNYIDSDAGSGQSIQTPCLRGLYNPSTGSTNASDCRAADAGHYVDIEFGDGQWSQTPCSPGTYNPLNGSVYAMFCINAQEGYFVNASNGEGQINQTICPSGTYNEDEGGTDLSDCVLVDAGYYSNSTGGLVPFRQKACPVGTYQPHQGKIQCIQADVGHVVTLPASTEQTPCSKGTYQPQIEQTECVSAEIGYYVNQTGQSNQTACLTGTYSNRMGSESCRDAGLGYYVDDLNRTLRIQCSEFTFTYVGNNSSGLTSSLLSDCWTDTDGDGLVDDNEADNSDDDDDNDGILDSLDVFPLNPDEWEDRNGDGQGDNQYPLSLTEEVSLKVESNIALSSGFFFAVIAGLVLVIKKLRPKNTSNAGETSSVANQSSDEIKIQVPLLGPPIPTAGLPEGWTVEQWIHYGSEWLIQQEAGKITSEEDALENLSVEDQSSPSVEITGVPDGNGYEWHTSEDGKQWYRLVDSSTDWTEYRA
jgi:alpha-tubulin suppressor-like RCC1 family protein